MRPPFRQPKFRKPGFRRPRLQGRSPKQWLLLSSLITAWVLAGWALVWVIVDVWNRTESSLSDRFHSDQSEPWPDQTAPLWADPNYGISQTLYDQWRRSQGQSPRSLAQLQPEEVKAIYQQAWQQGNCALYASPLDLACLDTMISFGIEMGRAFLQQLPPDPALATLEVAQRREAYRQQALAQGRGSGGWGGTRGTEAEPWDYGTAAPQPESIADGIARDRALITLVNAYSAAEQSSFSAELRQWLLSGTADAGGTGDRSVAPDRANRSPSVQTLSPTQLQAYANQFTVEVWLGQNGNYAPATGVIISRDGLILTNYHVVSEAQFQYVKLETGEEFTGEVLGGDPAIDLAFIQLEDATDLNPAPLATSSNQMQVGDRVYALGSPAGQHWHLSTAEIIAVQSDCGISVQCIRTPEGFLRPGNSGGPLLNEAGDVIGINRAIQQRTGEGVSIPIEIVHQFVGGDRSALVLPDLTQPDMTQPDMAQPNGVPPLPNPSRWQRPRRWTPW